MKISRKLLIISLAIILIAALIVGGCILLMDDRTPEDREVFTYQNFNYTILEDGNVQIEGYFGTDTTVVVPTAIDGRTVISIADGAFTSASFTKFYNGSFVERIGLAAFSGCTSLQFVDLGQALVEINDYLFYECNSLSQVVVPDTVCKVGNGSFYGCLNMSTVALPSLVSELGDLCFAYCTELESIGDAFSSVTKIGSAAFTECNALVDVAFPAAIYLGERVFDTCEELVSVSLGAEVASIGTGAFANCEKLVRVDIAEGCEAYTSEGGALVDVKNKTVLLLPPSSEVTSYTFPSYVERVEDYAFRNCLNLTEVILSEGLKTIGDYGFYFCDNLARIALPSSAEEVKMAFPATLSHVGGLAFERCRFFVTLTDEFNIVGDGILIKYVTPKDSTNNYAETANTSIVVREVEESGMKVERIMGVSVNVPAGVKKIASAFANNNSVVEVILPADTVYLSAYAFYHTTYAERIDLSKTAIGEIGDHAFDNCQLLTEILLPNTLTKIGEYLFMDCFALKSITIPTSLDYIGNYMFAECTKLETVVMHDGIKTIGLRAFNTARALKSITLPDALESIMDYAFCQSGLEEFTVPRDVEIGDYILLEATNLKKITIRSEGEMPIGLCMGATALTEVVFEGDFESISVDAFYDCNALTTITIPRSVSIIEARAFQFCTSLTEVVVKGSLDEVGPYAFYSCLKLEGFPMSRSTRLVDEYAFWGCALLKDIDLRHVKELGSNAFQDCTSLEKADLRSVPYVIPERAFSNCVMLTDVKLAPTVTEIGPSAFFVNRSLYSIELPRDLTFIGNGAFMGCESLKKIKWNEKLEVIDDKVFYWCDNIDEIILPDSVTTIGSSAFEMCHYMRTFKMGNNVTSIGDAAFRECTYLTSITLSSGLTEIVSNAFADSGLVSIELHEGIRKIDTYAFSGCAGLKRVDLPISCANVLISAFSGCDSLEMVVYAGTEEQFNTIYIEGDNTALTEAYANGK